jgi:hypothetical protein
LEARNEMSVVYHYSPDLMQLLVDTIEVLFGSKLDELLFFRGGGCMARSSINWPRRSAVIRTVLRPIRPTDKKYNCKPL